MNDVTKIDRIIETDLIKRGYSTKRIPFPDDFPRSVKFEEADFILVAWKGEFLILNDLDEYKRTNDAVESNL